MAAKKIYCHNCGKENLNDQKFCSECGTKLNKYSKSDRNVNVETKTLGNLKLLYIALGVIFLGGIILVLSGTFDSSPIISNNGGRQSNNQSFQNSQAGPDLSSIRKISELEKVLKNNPNDDRTLLQLANLLNDSRFFDRAIKEYSKYLKRNPKNADVMVDMGVCYYQLRNHTKAIETMKKALTINPKHQIANFNLGIVNFDAGNNKVAIEWWKKAVALNPNSNIGIKAQKLINQNNR